MFRRIFLSDLSFDLFRVDMELANCIYMGRGQNLDSTSVLKNYRRLWGQMAQMIV